MNYSFHLGVVYVINRFIIREIVRQVFQASIDTRLFGDCMSMVAA